MKVRIAVLSLLLAGCAAQISQTGPDSYLITKSSAGGILVSGASVKNNLIYRAGMFCAEKGKQIQVTTSQGHNAIPFTRTSSAEVEFKCIPPPPAQ